MKKLVQGFNTAAQDSNIGLISRESDALPLSHTKDMRNKHVVHYVGITNADATENDTVGVTFLERQPSKHDQCVFIFSVNDNMKMKWISRTLLRCCSTHPPPVASSFECLFSKPVLAVVM